MELDKEAIAKRLREFGNDNFPSIVAFASALGVGPATLKSSYLNGRSLPGSPMLHKLMELGLDIRWLFYGDEGTGEIERILDLQHRIYTLEEDKRILEMKLNKLKNLLE